MAIAVFSSSAPVRAAGHAVSRFGGEHGHPTTDNATALYYNPAALTASRGTHLFVDGLLAYRKVTYTRVRHPTDAPVPPDAEGANTGRGELLDALASPALGFTYQRENWAMGVGFFTPFGGFNGFHEREAFANHPRYPGPVDGVTRWHSIEGINFTSYGVLGLGYRLPDTGLSLGLSANLMLSRVEDLRAWSAVGNGIEGEGRSLLEATGLDFGFGAGLLYEVLPDRLWFGLSYQSRPNVSGGQRLSGSLQNDIGGPSGADVDLLTDLPDVIRLGLRYRPQPALELRLFGDVTRWSAFENQCIVLAGRECALEDNGGQPVGGGVLQNIARHWRDSFDVRTGASLWPRDGIEIMVGIGYGSSAVPDATLESGMPDFENVSFSLGSRLEITPKVFASLGYTQMLFVPRDVRSELSGYLPPTRSPDGSGHYTQSVGYIDVNVDVMF